MKKFSFLPNEQNLGELIRLGKILVFCLLIVVEIIVAANNHGRVVGINALWVIIPTEVALAAENAVKMWGLKTFKSKIACYVIDVLLLLVLTYFTNGALISTLYIIILTEFYFSQKDMRGSIAMGVSSVVLFLVVFAVSSALKGQIEDVAALVAGAFNDLIILTLHFLIVNFTLQIYRKNIEIAKTVDELNEANEKLVRANAELRAITALEERQRIAKDIHDTAGHSITTVIMQTEAAKLVIDSDPAEAKRELSAANLQAKHALEELRESVHLLSGVEKRPTLKDALLNIVHESTDGTDITIRSEIEDIDLCDAKSRFLCNSLKEGISNGLRHGGATAFWFECKQEGENLAFLLSDNGRGMKLSSFREGFGLKGMQKRAETLGGSVWFDTEPDEGFEIHISLPLDGSHKQEEGI